MAGYNLIQSPCAMGLEFEASRCGSEIFYVQYVQEQDSGTQYIVATQHSVRQPAILRGAMMPDEQLIIPEARRFCLN